MSSAIYNRSLTTIKTELEFLQESGIITQRLYDHFIKTLPDRYKVGMSAADYADYVPAGISAFSLNDNTNNPTSNTTPNTTTTPIPEIYTSNSPLDYCEALYDYSPQEPSDIDLKAGDIIQISDFVSNDWWKGKNITKNNDKLGMFPSNYVKRIPPPAHLQPQNQQQSRYHQPEPLSISEKFPDNRTSTQQQPPSYSYPSPPYPPVQAQPQSQQPYYPQQQPLAPVVYGQPQNGAVVVDQQQQEQTDKPVPESVKKFGSKLGNAAIFGAGATIGSNLVNSIF
ncbi:Pin3p [Ascoidea rubescens DSM 1968]|uniref:SH3-domain-containing protein n=1 Tax=Ascoidea rubescens DSM 1968 TaxID=1344418 RepID=A0A1D2VA18_9ASCO|nr:SH3-domain-containing protein [Ascoidea rubescens DSM 1968]ODV58500.1 SH3-domain-containing protein [Ascoidea rubescens DSM 1968]